MEFKAHLQIIQLDNVNNIVQSLMHSQTLKPKIGIVFFYVLSHYRHYHKHLLIVPLRDVSIDALLSQIYMDKHKDLLVYLVVLVHIMPIQIHVDANQTVHQVNLNLIAVDYVLNNVLLIWIYTQILIVISVKALVPITIIVTQLFVHVCLLAKI